ncbi:MAG: isocitrate lyase/phosphoenolpyruvate mutase family protein, partial [Candidatus Limnocylindria bacterium]
MTEHDLAPIRRLMTASAAYDPTRVAVARVAAAAEAAHRHGVVLTARAETHVYDLGDLDDPIRRLVAYRAAGADVIYAPRLTEADDIRR